MRALIAFFLVAALGKSQAIDKRDQEYWNGKFRDPATAFSRKPSPLLEEAIRGRSPGLAIDLGMGEGRNAIYLAQQGWRVTGVDLSDVAVEQALSTGKGSRCSTNCPGR